MPVPSSVEGAAIILVAESDRNNLELMSAALARAGLTVVASHDGNEALLKFFETRPAVVLVSIGLAGVNAEQLVGQFKAHSPHVRVVLLKVDAAQQVAVACDGVLDPPFRYAQLRDLLTTWGVLAAEAVATPRVGRVPTMKFELPPPVLPPDFGTMTLAAPSVSAPVGDGLAVPPLPTPIPLPVMRQKPPEELPELSLDEVVDGGVSAAKPVATPAPAPRAVPAPAAVPAPVEAALAPPPPAPADDAPELDLDEVSLEVESDAAASALKVPRQGDLAKQPLPRLIYDIYTATFTGVLHLSRGAVNRSLYFWGGLPVRVDAQQLNETLGRLLLEHGRITMEQYTRSLEIMQQKSCRQGDALVELGALSKTDLLDALKQQTEVKLANTFAWRDGTYRIDPDASFVRDTLLSELHPLHVIWRGVCEHYDAATLAGYFAPLTGSYIVATELFPVHFETLGPFLRELNVVEWLNGDTTFDALVGGAESLRTAQALYVLLVTDMARASAEPGKPVAAPDRAAASETVAAAPDAGEIKRLSDAIAAEYLRLKDCDFFDALRVDATAAPADVDAAYQNIMQPLHLDTLPAGLPEEVVKRARQIRDLLGRARQVLRDAQLRDRYVVHQRERYAKADAPATAAAGPAVPMTGAVKLEVDAVDRTARIVAEKAYSEGLRLMEVHRFAEAGVRFRDAVQHNGREPTYRVALGRAILRAEGAEQEGTRMKVVTCLQQALQLDPSHIEANLDMAKLLVTSGRRDRALAYVQRVLQRAPEHQEARQLLATLG